MINPIALQLGPWPFIGMLYVSYQALFWRFTWHQKKPPEKA